MAKIWVKGQARAKDGDVARFERWANELVDRVRASDPGTIAFGVYPDGGDGSYVFLEMYQDSAAALGHLANVGDLLKQMGDVADGSDQPLEVYGEISDELRDLYAQWNAKILPPLADC